MELLKKKNPFSRTKTIHFRVSESEYIELKSASKKMCDGDMSVFLRKACIYFLERELKKTR